VVGGEWEDGGIEGALIIEDKGECNERKAT